MHQPSLLPSEQPTHRMPYDAAEFAHVSQVPLRSLKRRVKERPPLSRCTGKKRKRAWTRSRRTTLS